MIKSIYSKSCVGNVYISTKNTVLWKCSVVGIGQSAKSYTGNVAHIFELETAHLLH